MKPYTKNSLRVSIIRDYKINAEVEKRAEAGY
jgi:hypothetical protein